MSLQSLKKVQNSKKSSMSMPIALKILEQHDARISQLEALHNITQTSCDSPVETVDIPEVIIPEPEPEPFIEPQTDIEYLDYEEQIIHKPPEQLEYEAQKLDELLDTLTRIQDEASLCEIELHSIKTMDEQLAKEEEDDDDNVSINTECTEACQELIDNNPEFSHNLFDCKSCLKAKAKAIKKEKKAEDKKRREQAKKLKEKQKSLLQVEQQEIAMKLKSLQMGLDTVGILNETKKRLNVDYNTLASEYYEGH